MVSATLGPAAIATGGLVAMAAAVGIGRFVYTPILPFMEVGIGLTKAEAGLIASANFVGYLLGALGASWQALPGERRTWLLVTLGLSTLTTGLMGFADSMSAFLALRFTGGVASAFVLVFASALVLDRLAEAGRSGLSAIHFAGVGCGIAVSAVMVAELAAAGHGWRAHWMASGAVSALALALAWVLVPVGSMTSRSAGPSRGVRADRQLIDLIVAYGLFGFGYVITATFISTMVRSEIEIRALESVIWLVVGLAAVPSVALWTWIGRWWGNDRSLALACLVEGVGVAMSVLVTGELAVLVSAALLGGTFMGITALGLIRARDLSSGDPRRSLALMTAAFGLGQMIGPTFAGFAHSFGDSFRAPSLVAAAALIIAAVLALDRRQH